MKPPLKTLTALCFAAALLGPAAAAAERFEFVALGDMPYGPQAEAYPVYANLISLVNRTAPAFTFHVGDFKDGRSPCSDEEFEHQRDFFNRFDSALVYTPGDNEWTDCGRPKAGNFDPLERLGQLRGRFFSGTRSLGRAPIALVRQADTMPAHAIYRENVRFERAGVLFVTLHMVGSNNNLDPKHAKATAEYRARDAANSAWIRAAFEEARRGHAKAIVFATHADPFVASEGDVAFPPDGAFTASVGQTLLPLVEEWGRPVLFVHGDSHRFTIDRPFHRMTERKRGPLVRNLVRLEVFGEDEVNAVRVGVDPDSPEVFSFTPLFNPLSPR